MTEKEAQPSLPPASRSPASGSTRTRVKSQKRWQTILATATELFTKRGFYATSMQDISDAVGIRKASLYYYVDSKEQLLFEILKDLHHGGVALTEGVNFNSSDPLGELRSFLVQIGIYTGKHANRLAIYARDFDYLDSEQQKSILIERRIYWDTVVRLIARAQELGHVASSIHGPTAAQVILSAVVSISRWFNPDRPVTIEHIAVQTAGILAQGLGAYDKR